MPVKMSGSEGALLPTSDGGSACKPGKGPGLGGRGRGGGGGGQEGIPFPTTGTVGGTGGGGSCGESPPWLRPAALMRYLWPCASAARVVSLRASAAPGATSPNSWAPRCAVLLASAAAPANTIPHAAAPVIGRHPMFPAAGPQCAPTLSQATVHLWRIQGHSPCLHSSGAPGVRWQCLAPLRWAGEVANKEMLTPRRPESGG